MYKTGDIVVYPGQCMVVKAFNPETANTIRTLPGVVEHDECFLLPHTEEACLVLQNLDFHPVLAAPFMTAPKLSIEGKYQPMPHQAITTAFMTYNPRAYVLSEPRLGKTGSLVMGMDYLQKKRYVTGAFLIITTVTTMPSVWRDSIQAAIPNAVIRIVHGPRREEELAKPAHFYITNYDSCRVSEKAFVQAVLAGRIGGCVIDELTHVANVMSKRHKAIANITRSLKYCYGATGTPGSKPEAIYGMCRMINPGRVPRTKGAWMSKVTYQYGPEQFMRILSDDAPTIFHNAMQPAIRFEKKDILHLPPITVQDREVAMTKDQEHIWEQLRADAFALTRTGARLTAANAGVLLGKLLQVGVGFCNSPEGEPVDIDFEPRMRAILDIIEETDRKVVIFGIYKYANRKVLDYVRSAGYAAELVDGDVTGQRRADILDSFSDPKSFKVLVAHPITTGIGTDLAASDTMILNGPPLLGGFVWGQTLERLSSVKQTSQNINIIRVSCLPEERRVFKGLDKGHKEAAIIANLFQEEFGGKDV